MADETLDVLLLAGRFEVRGSSTQTLNIAEYMPAHSTPQTASETDDDRSDNSDEDGEPPVNVRVICHNATRLSPQRQRTLGIEPIPALAWPVVGRFARRLLLSDVFADPPDVIHIQGLGMHRLGRWLAKRLKRPYVMTLHREVTPRDTFRLDRVYGRCVVATSDVIRQSVLEHTRTPEEQVVVIRNGVVHPEPRRPHDILGHSHRAVIGTAGPLEAGQGLSHFLRAIPRILAAGPAPLASPAASGDGPEFLIAGAGPDERHLRQLARELGVISKTTFVSNLYDFSEALDAMDIFCLPVERPGMGVTMLEAMARGVPVIATDIGQTRLILNDNETGIIIPPSNVDAIVSSVTSLLKDAPRARRLATAGRELVHARYPVAHMLDDMLNVYRAAL